MNVLDDKNECSLRKRLHENYEREGDYMVIHCVSDNKCWRIKDYADFGLWLMFIEEISIFGCTFIPKNFIQQMKLDSLFSHNWNKGFCFPNLYLEGFMVNGRYLSRLIQAYVFNFESNMQKYYFTLGTDLKKLLWSNWKNKIRKGISMT